MTTTAIQSELQLVREDLHWSEQRYREIFNQSRDGIIIFDTQQHCILDLNNSMAAMYGYRRDELLDNNITAIWPDHMSRIMALEQAVVEGHPVSDVLLDSKHKDGSLIQVEISASLIDLGGFPSILCVVSDDTNRKLVKDNLRASEQRYRAVTSTAHDAIIVADNNGTIISWNHGACQMFGYSEEDIIDQPLTRLMPERYRDKHLTKHGAATSTSERRDIHRTYEMDGLRSDGTEFPLEISISTWRTNESIYTTGIIRDISKRKHSEETLLESEKRFRSFFERAPEYCYMVGPDGTILDVNQAALEALGYEKDELLGKSIKTLYAPELQEKVQQLIRKWLETGELRNEELTIVTKTDNRRHILLSTANVTDDRGNLLHSISIQKDITELKQAQEQVIRSAKLSALGQLAAGIAHEVNNPLNTIVLATDSALYNGEELSSDIRRALVTSNEAAIRAGEIVANILEFSRERPMNRQQHNFHDLINKVLNITSADARHAKVKIQREFMTSAPQLHLDAIQIQQVFMNIILNAIQAMVEGGTLTIRTTSIDEGRKIAVEFVDTGVGIPESTQSKIFDPFYSTKPEGAGTGLGLSISYGLVEAHGGTIKVHSKVGEGTSFTIFFPTDHSKLLIDTANPLKNNARIYK